MGPCQANIPQRKLFKNTYIEQVPFFFFFLRDSFGENIPYVWRCFVIIVLGTLSQDSVSRKIRNMSLPNGYFASFLDIGFGK